MQLRKQDAGSNKRAYRVTVRQLESLIRLSEARARLDFSPTILVRHVNDAVTLLKGSIAKLDRPDLELDDEEVQLPKDGDEQMRDTDGTQQLVQPETRKVKLDFSS